MKWMIASDLHGSAFYCKKMIKAFERERADRLLLLGDLLYHGPRNDLPEGYAPKEVIPLLNGLKPALLCVRGNCDAEVDQMVLDFPILADYAVLPVGRRLVYATHGHVHNLKNLPPLAPGDVLLHLVEILLTAAKAGGAKKEDIFAVHLLQKVQSAFVSVSLVCPEAHIEVVRFHGSRVRGAKIAAVFLWQTGVQRVCQ